MSNLIIGVGMPFTGNQQLADRLTELGCKVRIGGDWDPGLANAFYDRGDTRIMDEAFQDGYDAWVGWPVCCYGKLFVKYPEATFVQTVRAVDKWEQYWRDGAECKDTRLLAYLFDSENPTVARAVTAYSHTTDTIQTFMSKKHAKFAIVNLEGRRSDRILGKIAGNRGPQDGEV